MKATAAIIFEELSPNAEIFHFSHRIDYPLLIVYYDLNLNWQTILHAIFSVVI